MHAYHVSLQVRLFSINTQFRWHHRFSAPKIVSSMPKFKACAPVPSDASSLPFSNVSHQSQQRFGGFRQGPRDQDYDAADTLLSYDFIDFPPQTRKKYIRLRPLFKRASRLVPDRIFPQPIHSYWGCCEAICSRKCFTILQQIRAVVEPGTVFQQIWKFRLLGGNKYRNMQKNIKKLWWIWIPRKCL